MVSDIKLLIGKENFQTFGTIIGLLVVAGAGLIIYEKWLSIKTMKQEAELNALKLEKQEDET